MNTSERRYDFDWLRVLLILTVLVFHSLRFFNLEGWGIKNATTYLLPEVLVIFISRWLMPVMFVISGIATFYALESVLKLRTSRTKFEHPADAGEVDHGFTGGRTALIIAR